MTNERLQYQYQVWVGGVEKGPNKKVSGQTGKFEIKWKKGEIYGGKQEFQGGIERVRDWGCIQRDWGCKN